MIDIAMSSSTATVTIRGDLDLAERNQFPGISSRLRGLRRPALVIDMCGVGFMDSTGAAFLIALADGAGERGGTVLLRGCDERNLFVLGVCGALELFRVDREHRCLPVAS